MPVKNPFFLIKNINDRFEAKGNTECQAAGLTLSQFKILGFLNFNSEHISNHTVTQRELEKEFHVSHPTINGILKRMEEKNFITTKIVKEGKQQKQVFITGEGKKAIQKIDSIRINDDKKLTEMFTKEELDNLDDYLRRILNYLNQK